MFNDIVNTKVEHISESARIYKYYLHGTRRCHGHIAASYVGKMTSSQLVKIIEHFDVQPSVLRGRMSCSMRSVSPHCASSPAAGIHLWHIMMLGEFHKGLSPAINNYGSYANLCFSRAHLFLPLTSGERASRPISENAKPAAVRPAAPTPHFVRQTTRGHGCACRPPSTPASPSVLLQAALPVTSGRFRPFPGKRGRSDSDVGISPYAIFAIS